MTLSVLYRLLSSLIVSEYITFILISLIAFGFFFFFFFQAEDGIRDWSVTGVQTCALPILIARQVAAMRDAGLDAIVSISPENFAYVTGFLSPTQPIMRWRHAMALVTADGATALVVVDMEANTIRSKAPPGTDIAVWREFKFDAMSVLADLLRQRGLAKARV